MTTAIVVATVYSSTIGTPLFCDTWDTDLSFHSDQEPFLAWPFDVAGGQCGDIILVIAGEDWDLYKALDSGGFGHHCVMEGDMCHPIVVDIPMFFAPFDGLSAEVRVVNVSAQRRKMERRRR